MRARRRLTAAAACLLLAAGCSAGSGADAGDARATTPTAVATTPAPTATASYVALGDSFTAGPGIAPQQPDAGLCQRSQQNWPTLVAAATGLDLHDVSCTGATTADLAATVASGAVPADTGLVTVSAGGNDGGLFVSLIRACVGGSATCSAYVDDQAPAVLAQTTSDLATLLADTRTAAPDADVVLVGYPRIMPSSGTCAAVGIQAADVATVVAAETALDEALAAAAQQAGVRYVPLRASSEGHDACAGDAAWTNGTAPAADDGIVFHPNRRGMAAVADVVAAAVNG